ncbi:hypothetical protein [Xenorhabdus sp. SGI246]|uniref:hypothetical protein n=1 Tax=Xenorhabdus sp. SGI246 TaxID=3158263 RepID=UPI00349F949B
MKTVKVDWLGDCARCGSGVALVETESRKEGWLREEDKVTCIECGHTGYVDIDDSSDESIAYAVWE